VECKGERDRQILLELYGDDIDNSQIRVSRLDKRMDGDEIISNITEKLRDKDALNRLESSLGLTSEIGPKIHFEPPRQHHRHPL